MQSWAGGELLDYLQAPALGKPWHRKALAVLGTKGHGGGDGVVPLPSPVQEQLCPGLIPAKGSGKCLGTLRLRVVGCGLGTQSPAKGEGHKEHSVGTARHEACPHAGVVSTGEIPGLEGEGEGSHMGWAVALRGVGQRLLPHQALCDCFIFCVVPSNKEQLCCACCPRLAEQRGSMKWLPHM